MIARVCLTLMLAGTTAANVATLSQNPFAAPMIDRTGAELSVAFDRAVADVVDAAWLLPRMADALSTDDAETAAVLARLAQTHNVALPPDMTDDLAALDARNRGVMACVACALEVGTCPDLTRIATCNLPFEVTPFGDANALRRAARDYLSGSEVDQLDAALGAVGLTATLAVPLTGGTSITVKAGATLLRAARRAGALAPRMVDELVGMATGVIRWDRAGDVALGRVGVEAFVDSARAGRLTAVATDATRLVANTSPTDALALVRLADTPDDLARIARLSDSAGDATRPGIHALGTARAFRLMTRISDMVFLALGLLTALAAQIATLIGHRLVRSLTRRRA